jgi:hypothetical protein
MPPAENAEDVGQGSVISVTITPIKSGTYLAFWRETSGRLVEGAIDRRVVHHDEA